MPDSPVTNVIVAGFCADRFSAMTRPERRGATSCARLINVCLFGYSEQMLPDSAFFSRLANQEAPKA